MISINDIITAINKILVINFPTYPVYIQRCPENFKRPSFFIEHIRTSVKDANCKMVEKTMYITITGFAEKNSHYISEITELNNIQNKLINVFNSCSLKIGDRSIKLQSSSGGFDNDSIFIDLQLNFYDNRIEENNDGTLIINIEMKTSIKKIQEE